MNGQWDTALLGQRRQHRDAVGARRVGDDRARPHGRGRRETRYETCEFSVGDSQQQQFGAGGDLVWRQDGGVWQPAFGALPRRVRNRATRNDNMIGALQRYTQRRADPTSGNDANREPRRTQSVDMLHCRRPRKLSWFLRSGPALRVPDGRYEPNSLVAAPATAAAGRGGLKPRQQLGDRLAAGVLRAAMSPSFGLRKRRFDWL